MQRFVTCLMAALAWALAACAAPAADPGPALWRIHDADSEIWLFGSVHVLPSALSWRSPRIDAAFASADELVLETDTSAASDFAAIAQRLGTLPAGQTLSAQLTPAERTSLEQAAKAARLDPATLESLRPWLAALRLSVYAAMAEGQDPNAGVESVLLADAQASHKRVSAFETPEQQIRVLADLSPADERRFFDSTLDDLAHAQTGLDEADRAWVRGDTQALARLLGPELREAGPGVYDALITRRNARWADEIARRLEGSGRIFIVVGAGHLVGPGSVVALLRARGIQVEGP